MSENILRGFAAEFEEHRQRLLEKHGVARIVNAIESDPWWRFGAMWRLIALTIQIERSHDIKTKPLWVPRVLDLRPKP